MDKLMLSSLDYTPYFLGLADQNNILKSLFAHRFESSFLRRIMGDLPREKIHFHETLFRSFLEYAQQDHLDMGWSLGLHFLKWAVANHHLPHLHHNHEVIITRVVYRWINASHRDFDFKAIIIPLWPYSSSIEWIVGKKSTHPHHLPRLFKAQPVGLTSPNELCYCLLPEFPMDTLPWQFI